MFCENCQRETDIIKRVKLGSFKEMNVCINCYNNQPAFYGLKAETIKED